MDSPDLGYSPDLFVRPDDKARLDRMVRAVSDEQLSIAFISESDALLDHYGRLFAEQLRRTSRLAVEIYSPDSTDALIDRFNRILASMSVSEALKTEGSMAPSRLLLVYDGRATGVREVQLLARLLKDFPGANTRVALLLHAHADAPKKVEAFGKRMIHWELNLPSPAEKQALLEKAANQGSLPEAQAFLALLGEESNASQALQETLSVLARADEALGLSPGSTQSELAKRTAKNSISDAAEDASVAEKQSPSFSATMAPLRSSAASAKEEPRLSGMLDDDSVAPIAADPRQPATPKKKFPAILVVGILALGASALLNQIQKLPEIGGEPTPPPASTAPPSAASAPQAAVGASSPSPAATDALPTPPSTSDANKNIQPVTGTPTSPTQAATDTPAAGTATPPAAVGGLSPPATSAPAGQRQFIVKGPIPERQETDPAVRLAPGTVNAAGSTAPAPVVPTPVPSTPTPQALPTVATPPPPASARTSAAPARQPPSAPAAQARPAPAPRATQPGGSGGVNRPEVLADLSAGFYVQHIASPSRGNVEVFWRSRPSLRQARLLELRRTPGSQTPNFVLVSGPFETMVQAQQFMAQPGLPRDMWLREASKIRPFLPNP